jgi:hypothetical protein
VPVAAPDGVLTMTTYFLRVLLVDGVAALAHNYRAAFRLTYRNTTIRIVQDTCPIFICLLPSHNFVSLFYSSYSAFFSSLLYPRLFFLLSLLLPFPFNLLFLSHVFFVSSALFTWSVLHFACIFWAMFVYLYSIAFWNLLQHKALRNFSEKLLRFSKTLFYLVHVTEITNGARALFYLVHVTEITNGARALLYLVHVTKITNGARATFLFIKRHVVGSVCLNNFSRFV